MKSHFVVLVRARHVDHHRLPHWFAVFAIFTFVIKWMISWKCSRLDLICLCYIWPDERSWHPRRQEVERIAVAAYIMPSFLKLFFKFTPPPINFQKGLGPICFFCSVHCIHRLDSNFPAGVCQHPFWPGINVHSIR